MALSKTCRRSGLQCLLVVAWGPLADRCGRYLKKGSGVLVEGKLRVRSYEARDGSGKKYSTEVEALDVTFVGSRRSSEDGAFAPQDRRPESGFSDDGDFGKSISEKGFGDEFPMDFAEMERDDKDSEADIPF